ncbi:MAG: hypothetical protein POELPBGB_01317 [Bacteroidia bacterium]|nr:hypothetical protein [Bacteroidia bacterium]
MNIFYEEKIENLFNKTNQAIKSYISSINENDILAKDGGELSEEIAQKFRIKNNLKFHADKKSVDVKMENLPVELLPAERRMFARESHYPMAVVYYTFEYEGNAELWRYLPQKHFNWTIDADVTNGNLTFAINTMYGNVNLNPDMERYVTSIAQNSVEKINHTIEYLNSECEAYNATIATNSLYLIIARKSEVKQKQEQKNRLTSF